MREHAKAKENELLKPFDQSRMGHHRAPVARNIASEETDPTARLKLSRPDGWDALPIEKWLQLGRLAQGPAARLNRFLSLQRVAQSGHD